MSLSDKEIEKIYRIKSQLLSTYKVSQKEEQKKRISHYIKEVDMIIKDIENGNWVNPVKLNILTQNVDSEDNSSANEKNYKNLVQIEKISDLNKDSELDQLYSYLNYFEEHFLPPMSQTNLKLDYALSRKRDDFYVKYDSVKHLVKEFIADFELLCKLTNKDQIDKYKERINLQKHHLLVKISELLNDIRDFLTLVITDLNEGRKSLFNAAEKYSNKFDKAKKGIFTGQTMEYIIRECAIFIDDFIDILRMPDFKK